MVLRNNYKTRMPVIFVIGATLSLLSGCADGLVDGVQALQDKAMSPRMVLTDPSLNTIAANGMLNFPDTGNGSTKDLIMTIFNSGKKDLSLDVAGISITGGDGKFSIITLPPANIPTGQSETFTLRFSPTVDGLKTAVAIIPTNDLITPRFTFTIRGTGIGIILSTDSISAITYITGTGGGDITLQGDTPVIVRGVCWGTTPNPTTANYTAISGAGPGIFSCSLTNLIPGTYYYVRSFATNSTITAYGSSVSFTTTAAPAPTTTAPNDINTTTAKSGGNVALEGSMTMSARGVCWSTSHNPTTADSKTNDGTVAGTFTSSLTGLTKATTYYVRAYAIKSGSTVYGPEQSLKTVGYTGPGGGYVFYDYGSVFNGGVYANYRYLEAAPFTSAFSWGPSNTLTSVNATVLGTGNYNTTLLLAPTTYGAANICGAYAVDATDWFLPSKDELHVMFQNLYAQSLGLPWYATGYWTSSEWDKDYAWIETPAGAASAANKTFSFYVRPIRSYQ